MAVKVKHKFTSTRPDGGDPTQVQPSNWNEEHTIEGVGTGAGLDVPATSGTAATSAQLVRGDDPRLLDARSPTAHNHGLNDLTGASTIGKSLLGAADAAAARALISAARTDGGNTFSASQSVSAQADTGTVSLTVTNTSLSGASPSARVYLYAKKLDGTALRMDQLAALWNGQLYLSNGSGGTGIVFEVAGSAAYSMDPTALYPFFDNAVSLAKSSNRFTTGYFATSPIVTSDARAKTDIRALSDDETQAAVELASEVRMYRFCGSVADKGECARLHCGVIAQRVVDVMQRHGLDPFRYGFVCLDSWEAQTINHPAVVETIDTGLVDDAEAPITRTEIKTEAWVEHIPAGERFAIRYDELTAFILAGIAARIGTAPQG